jgi:hypothetical protein
MSEAKSSWEGSRAGGGGLGTFDENTLAETAGLLTYHEPDDALRELARTPG